MIGSYLVGGGPRTLVSIEVRLVVAAGTGVGDSSALLSPQAAVIAPAATIAATPEIAAIRVEGLDPIVVALLTCPLAVS